MKQFEAIVIIVKTLVCGLIVLGGLNVITPYFLWVEFGFGCLFVLMLLANGVAKQK